MKNVMTPLSSLMAVFLSLASFLAWSCEIREASGHHLHGDDLYIVSDEVGYLYYKYDLTDLDEAFQSVSLGVSDKCSSHRITRSDLPLDFESIEVVDTEAGLIALVVSEQLSSILLIDVHADMVMDVIELGDMFNSIGGRGVEGVAVRRASDKTKLKIAVLWEGGYLSHKKTNHELRGMLDDVSLAPVLSHYEYDVSDKSHKLIGADTLQMDGLNLYLESVYGDESGPYAMRFRAVDLVFHSEDLIILLNSERMLIRGSKDKKSKYGVSVLQRFDDEGSWVGEPVDVHGRLKQNGIDPHQNWEGLTWFDDRSLILINDTHRGAPEVVKVGLPEAWLRR